MLIVLVAGVLASPPGVPAITTHAGSGIQGYAGDGGPAIKARLDNPFAVALDTSGNLYFSDTNNHVVRRVDGKSGTISTVAGSGKKGYTGDGGPAIRAALNEPYGIALDAQGHLYIVDRLNSCIRAVHASTGIIKTVVGGFKEPNGLCLFGSDKLLMADVKDEKVFEIDLRTGAGIVFAGTGAGQSAGDGGPAAKASFNGARAVRAHGDGSVFIVERGGNCIRRVDSRGIVNRFAGTGQKGYSGDGGPALKATFDGPKEIAVDASGNVFVVDTENEVIRRIDAKTGVITTVAGTGKSKTPGLGDRGPALSATLGRPHGVAIGTDGAIYIGDTLSHRIRRVK